MVSGFWTAFQYQEARICYQLNRAMEISQIIEAIHEQRIRVSDHADVDAHEDRLSCKDVYQSVLQGKIIEDYPTDTPYPSCLIYGQNITGDPIHSVWAYNPDNRWAVLIKVYRPDPNQWINWIERRKE